MRAWRITALTLSSPWLVWLAVTFWWVLAILGIVVLAQVLHGSLRIRFRRSYHYRARGSRAHIAYQRRVLVIAIAAYEDALIALGNAELGMPLWAVAPLAGITEWERSLAAA